MRLSSKIECKELQCIDVLSKDIVLPDITIYILTGKNLLIEKQKRRMVTEDIREAVKLI